MANSYAWSTIVRNQAVENGDDLWLNTPGFEHPEHFDTENAEVVHNGRVIQPEERTLTWDDDFENVEITNRSDTPWEPSDTIYLTVSATSGSGSDTTEARVEQLEIEVDKLHERVKSLETRVAALENPPAGRS